MNGYRRNVLVVASHQTERDRLGAALEREGFQVMLCSGPEAPDYSCLGSRTGRCPLATDDSVVVLDIEPHDDVTVLGTSGEDLLGFYLEAGHPVLALSGRPTGAEDEHVLELRRHPEIDLLLDAVWRLASR
jgi:hypothetical protein